MIVGAHMSQRCKNHIQQADIVFISCHPIMEQWIATLHHDVRSLQHCYAEGKDRRQTYREMEALIMGQVRAGKRVTGVFYGHPGVFALVPHNVVKAARAEGFQAAMEPGISAEDCLYADLGIDPGRYGCQHFEASQFMFYRRKVDTAGYLILWQIALAGDRSVSKRFSSLAERQVLLDLLYDLYPHEHEVILYECPTLMTDSVRAEHIPLYELATATLSQITTLIIPPATRLIVNTEVMQKLSNLAPEPIV